MMKKILTLAILGFLFGGAVEAQQTFPLFRPSNGILVGQNNTYITSAAASSNVISLWTGTCNASTFLRGDGSCQIVTSVSPANPTGTIGLTANNGVLDTYTRSDATPALSQAIVPTWTGLHTWSATAPALRLFASGAVTDRKDIRLESGSGGQLQLNAYTDAGSVMNTLIIASRASGGFTTSTFGHNNGTVSLSGTALNLVSNGTTRLAITSAGEWQLAGAGGTATNVLTSAGPGAPPTWAAAGGTPAGSDTQVQFNNAGAFGGDADYTWALTTNILTLGTQPTPATIQGGTGSGTNGALLTVRGGQGGTTNNGGASILQGGLGGATSGNGGSVNVLGGVPTDGNGGAVTIQANAGVGTNRNGGTVTMSAGTSTGSGSPGAVNITGGAVSTAIQAGAVNLTGGNAGTLGTVGGQASVTGGSGGTVGNGGNLQLTAAAGGSTSGNGGIVTMSGGAGSAGNANGGQVSIIGGNASGSGTGGNVQFTAGTSPTGTPGVLTSASQATMSAQWTFTQGASGLNFPITASSAAPGWQLRESGVAANNGIWQFYGDSETLFFDATNDAGAGVHWLQVDRTGNTVDTVNISATAVQANGVAVATYITGSYTGTIAGCTTSPTVTINYTKIVDVVTVKVPSFSCTSNSTGLNITGAPATIRPLVTTPTNAMIVTSTDNSAANFYNASMYMNAAGTIEFARGASGTAGWTAAGTKAVTGVTGMTYIITN